MPKKVKVDEDAPIQPDGSVPQKPSVFQTIGAAIAGLIAVKVATYLVATMWRLVTREDPPQVDQRVAVGKKAAWIGLVGAASGAARQAARDMIKPPSEGPA
ncbi:MAG: hypothetical protein ACRDKT_15260 [Actinomycetota bacterium]